VGVTETWGAPLAAPATAVAPTAGAAPLKALTVMQPLRPLLPSVATTDAPVSGAERGSQKEQEAGSPL